MSETRRTLQEETDLLAAEEILAPAYQRKKLIMWFIRNAITALLIWYFWEKDWIRWVLWIGIPIAVINLLMILLGPYLLRKKLERVRKKLD